MNCYFDERKPWTKKNNDEIKNLKYLVFETLRISSILLYPILPNKMTQILNFLNCENNLNLIYFSKQSKIFFINDIPPKIFNKIIKK
jgi:methionyl-tRNA synthetase